VFGCQGARQGPVGSAFFVSEEFFLKAPFLLFDSQCNISNDNAQNEQAGMIWQNEIEMVPS